MIGAAVDLFQAAIFTILSALGLGNGAYYTNDATTNPYYSNDAKTNKYYAND